MSVFAFTYVRGVLNSSGGYDLISNSMNDGGIDEKRFRTRRGGISYAKTVQITPKKKNENNQDEENVEKGYHNTKAGKKIQQKEIPMVERINEGKALAR